MKFTLDLEFDQNIRKNSYKLQFRAGSRHTLKFIVEESGVAFDATGYTAKLYYYDDESDTSSYTIESDATTAASGLFTFNVIPSDLAEVGSYRSELVILDASSNEFYTGKGAVVVKKSILDTAVSVLTAGPVIAWSAFSGFSGTSASGPYREGTGITMSENADGSVDINSASGSGDVTAAAVIADNAVVRGDGGVKGVQDSSASIDDSGNLTVNGLTVGADVEMANFAINDVTQLIGPNASLPRVDLTGASFEVRVGDGSTGNRVSVRSGETEFNVNRRDQDFAVHSDGVENIIFVNGATNQVAVNGVVFDSSANITTSGTVDGRDVSADGTKLDTCETSSTADQTDSEIETAYNNQVGIVSQVAAEAGTSTTAERWTPERVAQAIAALGGGGGFANPATEDLDMNGSNIIADGLIHADGGTLTLQPSAADSVPRMDLTSSSFKIVDNWSSTAIEIGSSGVIINPFQTTRPHLICRGDTDANLLRVDAADDRVGIGRNPTAGEALLQIAGDITQAQQGDPAEPASGDSVIWVSDGTGKGSAGDVLIATNVSGTTKWGQLFNHAGGSAW